LEGKEEKKGEKEESENWFDTCSLLFYKK